MFKDREKMYQVYHTILSMMLTWALALAINGYFVLKVHVIISALFCIALAVLVHLFDLNRKNPISYLVLLGIFPVLGLFFWIRDINVLIWLKSLGAWIYEYDFSEELYVASHAHVILFTVALIGIVIFYLLMKRQAAKTILAVGLFAMLITFSVLKIEINKLVVMICIFYMLSILIEIGGKIYSRKAGRPEKKAGILYLAPVCLLLAVISISMPSNPEPIQWKGVKTIYKNVKDKIDNLLTDWEFFRGKGKGEFSLALTGYSEDQKELGSESISKNDKVALMVSGYRGNAPLYLIGSVNDIYTGYSWEKSRTDYMPDDMEYYLDFTEFIYAMSRQDMEVLENQRFVDRKIIKITYDNIRTKTFFYPIKSSWFEIYKNAKEPNPEQSNIIFPKAMGGGTSYEIIYYEMNLQGKMFQQMLRDADSFSYAEGREVNVDKIYWVETVPFLHDSAASIMSRWDFYEIFRARAALIKDKYTVLPETLPDRVRELAIDITEDADTSYDKLKAIEEYLLSYSYSLKPGRTPKDADFVDYFLFENKKGYCTAFASSMAVLARCAGIPTRYVEGFVVDYSTKEDNSYLVKNNKAHSWAEAYIEGVGWIPFEATPPFFERRYVAWKEKPIGYENQPDYSSQYEEQEQNIPEEELPLVVEDKGLPGAAIAGIILLFTLVVLILIFVVYYMILRYRYRKKFKKMDYSRKMYMLFLRILTQLKREGFSLDSQETILMLNDRVKDLYHYNKVVFLDVAKVFMRYRYAHVSITEAEFKQVDTYYNGLKDKQREETGRLKQHLEEFIFLSKKSNR